MHSAFVCNFFLLNWARRATKEDHAYPEKVVVYPDGNSPRMRGTKRAALGSNVLVSPELDLDDALQVVAMAPDTSCDPELWAEPEVFRNTGEGPEVMR